MRSHIAAGKWKQLHGRVRERWAKLSDDDLNRIGGRMERLAGALEERYGYARKYARRDVADFLDEVAAKPRYLWAAVGGLAATIVLLVLVARGKVAGDPPEEISVWLLGDDCASQAPDNE